MAKSVQPVFAIGDDTNITKSISSGILTYPAYILNTDKDTLAFLNSDGNIHNVKGYNQESIIYVDSLPESDARTDAFYICNGIGYLYINSVPVPVFSDITDKITSYNSLTDTPITNEVGTLSNPIVLSELDNGSYSVTGHYQITSDDTVFITSRQVLFLVDSDVDNKYVTKFGTGEILLYSISAETGEMSTDEYAKQSWVDEQGYFKKDDIDEIGDDFISGLFN